MSGLQEAGDGTLKKSTGEAGGEDRDNVGAWAPVVEAWKRPCGVSLHHQLQAVGGRESSAVLALL